MFETNLPFAFGGGEDNSFYQVDISPHML